VRLVVVLDCLDPDKLADFWVAALDYDREPLSEPYIVLKPRAGAVGPELVLQRVPEPKLTKNRMHLDMRVDNLDSELESLDRPWREQARRGNLGGRLPLVRHDRSRRQRVLRLPGAADPLASRSGLSGPIDFYQTGASNPAITPKRWLPHGLFRCVCRLVITLPTTPSPISAAEIRPPSITQTRR
jgi:Glyoxalase-like domain